MYVPISKSWLSAKFIVDFTSLTSYEQIVIILLANILFYLSFKFFYSIIKDMFRCIKSVVRGILRWA